jgi:hypothetical protein
MVTHIVKRAVLGMLAAVLLFGLVGCVQGEVSLDVKKNGSCLYGISLGLTRQALSLVSSLSGNGDPANAIQQLVASQGSFPEGVALHQWYEGDYQWVRAEATAASLDEINQLLLSNHLANSFSLTEKKGFLQNEFLLDAELAPLTGKALKLGWFTIDPTAVVPIRFTVRMPGRIQETNGILNGSDPSQIAWNIDGDKPVRLHARSVVLNWLNIEIAVGLALVVVIIALILLVKNVARQFRKKSPAPAQN